MSDAPVLFTELSARRVGPVRRFFVERPVAMDVLLVVCFAGWALLLSLSADSSYVLHAYLGGDRVAVMQVVSTVLVVVGAASLLWRRRRPVLVAAVMCVVGVVSLAVTGGTWGVEVGVAMALYAVGAWRRATVAWAVTGVVLVVLLVATVVFPLPTTMSAIIEGTDVTDPVVLAAVHEEVRGTGFLESSGWYRTVVPLVVLAVPAVAVGTGVRTKRLHLAAFVEAANALARDQDQRARLARAAERARIAREMHDVVAHSISVMVALGGGAAAAVDWAPQRSREALDELVSTGRAALGDMRRVLGVLHDEEDPSDGAAGSMGPRGGDAVPLAPQPGVLDLGVLVERFRTAGLPVDATGCEGVVSAGAGASGGEASLELAVYRIVQEALTNTLRHAPGTPSVTVAVREHDDHVEVVVTDEGPTRPVVADEGSGRGLVGMRERAAVFGGTVEAGPHGEGWRVRAVLPRREGDA
jgi:signal transduction histidine kinase